MGIIAHTPTTAELNRKARSKAKLDNSKTYAYGWYVSKDIKVGDSVTIQNTYGPRGLKGSLTYNEACSQSDIVVEIESKVTRIFRRSDLKDISNEPSTTLTDSGNTIRGDSCVHESEGKEEWNG